MDFGGNIFCLSNGNNKEQNGPHNNNNNNDSSAFAWDSWQNPSSTTPNHSRLFSTFYATASAADAAAAVAPHEASLENALMFLPQASSSPTATITPAAAHDDGVNCPEQQQVVYSGDGSHLHPDPHLMCLKLGKRHYFEDANGHLGDRHVTGDGGLSLAGKRGKGDYFGGGGGGGASVKAPTFAAATVPRCQVEGCHVALLNAKDYHRRHKVCEMHSKAPKVVVLGLEQRFCQQCSRFHVVSEFDDSKRSCRRRLAGHNERRRKSSHDSVTRNSSQAGCALSLLSSKSDSWLSPADLSSRCSAALCELIAENRAAAMARHLMSERDHWLSYHHPDAVEEQLKDYSDSNSFPLQHHMYP